MSLDTTLLKLLKDRSKYELYARSIDDTLIEPHTRVLLKDYGKFFYESQGVDKADLDTFLPWFLLAHPKLKDEAKAALTLMIRNAQGDVPPGVEQGILSRLEATRQVSLMTSIAERFAAGEEIDVLAMVRSMADSIPMSADAMPKVTTSIDDMLDEEQNDWGFKWRLNILNQSMRCLRPGDFGILGARVDVGKTSWFASELSYMAPQVDLLFPGEERTIIILNNEGPGSRIKQRVVQATLGMSIPQMVKARQEGVNLWHKCMDMWGGREVIQVFDVHDRPMSRLEEIVRRMNAAIIVCDMLDVVPYDGGVMNGGTRADQILEAAYQRARLWAVKYRAVVLAASQLSAEAATTLFPGLHMLANSRTGKPGAADFVATLAASEDVNLQHARWVGLPKNKLHRSGGPKDPRAEVRFKGDRARIEDPSNVEDVDGPDDE